MTEICIFPIYYPWVSPYEERANLRTPITGIPGLIYASRKRASHGPRVKFGVRDSHDSIAITISDNPTIVADGCSKEVKAAFERVWDVLKPWIIRNLDALLRFWNDDQMSENELLNLLRR